MSVAFVLLVLLQSIDVEVIGGFPAHNQAMFTLSKLGGEEDVDLFIGTNCPL